MLNDIILSVIMLAVIMPSVVILNVAAPQLGYQRTATLAYLIEH
jgi:hypothetical protein